MKKGFYFIIVLMVGLFLLANTHLKSSLGDSLFKAIGLSPWTDKNNTGLFLPAIIGLVLLLIGIVGTVRNFRSKYPKILSRLIMGTIAFFLVFPYVSEGVMFLVKHNSKGIDSIDISKGNCNFKTEDNHVIANCNFAIFNYGQLDRIAIKPILKNDFYESIGIEFEKNILTFDRHSKRTINMQFIGVQRNGSGMSGSIQDVGFELDINHTSG
ncbi:hypothetical protein [Paenibacillus sp. KN14-4R]|uniref:hypothetical protein n=1 Tax=Paenibacillus sp. KN14-4R TaxID=3445773 RepID=UPI003FA08E78